MKNLCLKMLQTLPRAIGEAENDLVEGITELQEDKDLLADKEADLLVNGKIDGKNAEIRAAQMRELTKMERNKVSLSENNVSRIKARLNAAGNEFKAWRSIAGLLKEVE